MSIGGVDYIFGIGGAEILLNPVPIQQRARGVPRDGHVPAKEPEKPKLEKLPLRALVPGGGENRNLGGGGITDYRNAIRNVLARSGKDTYMEFEAYLKFFDG